MVVRIKRAARLSNKVTPKTTLTAAGAAVLYTCKHCICEHWACSLFDACNFQTNSFPPHSQVSHSPICTVMISLEMPGIIATVLHQYARLISMKLAQYRTTDGQSEGIVRKRTCQIIAYLSGRTEEHSSRCSAQYPPRPEPGEYCFRDIARRLGATEAHSFLVQQHKDQRSVPARTPEIENNPDACMYGCAR